MAICIVPLNLYTRCVHARATTSEAVRHRACEYVRRSTPLYKGTRNGVHEMNILYGGQRFHDKGTGYTKCYLTYTLYIYLL